MNLHRRVLVAAPWFRAHPRRLAIAPRVTAVDERDGEQVLRVDGMVCSVCAARTRSALASLPGVRSAEVDLDSGLARLTLDAGAGPTRASAQQAIDRVVLAAGLRRWIERHAPRWARRTQGED